MKKKILILSNYSAGICGVWQRAKVEAAEFKKRGYDVYVFSSNATKGNNNLANPEEIYEGIKIKRFPFKTLGGESYMKWDFEKQAIELEPDIIIAHNYRHIHTSKALKIKKILKTHGKDCKVFLITHAPFVKNRPFFPRIIVKLKDYFNNLNKFDKVITISKWEIPLLLKLGCKKEKIIHIPNSIPNEFFVQKKSREEKKILYLGRIHPRKDIGTLMKGFKNSDLEKTYQLEIVGLKEEQYYQELLDLKNKLNLKARFTEPIFDLKEKIKKIDSAEIMVLPSKFEPFGIVFLEAMARGKIVVATKTQGSEELIIEGFDGLKFKVGDYLQLCSILNNLNSKQGTILKKSLKKNAQESAKKFKVSKIIDKWEKLF
jgi:glycosyltransferase involved in cell wall biosynthesis